METLKTINYKVCQEKIFESALNAYFSSQNSGMTKPLFNFFLNILTFCVDILCFSYFLCFDSSIFLCCKKIQFQRK